MLLHELGAPRTRKELAARIAKRLAKSTNNAKVIDQAIGLLADAGVIENVDHADNVGDPQPAPHSPCNVAVALGGGITAAHAPLLCELLIARGFRVRCLATPSALRFVSKRAIEAMTHEPLVDRMWSGSPKHPAPHIELARWADLCVVVPATATTLSRIARGDCSTVVSAVAIATRAPVLLVPAMNESMFLAPSIQRNLECLRTDGFLVAHPAFGYEVAEDPSRRTPAFGAAPPLSMIVDLIDAIVRTETKRTT